MIMEELGARRHSMDSRRSSYSSLAEDSLMHDKSPEPRESKLRSCSSRPKLLFSKLHWTYLLILFLSCAVAFLLFFSGPVVPYASLETSFSSSQTSSSVCNYTVGSAVETTSGLVYGHRAPNASQVSEYLGIPYAAPPVGALRFAAPVKYQGDGIVNGSSFGHDCPVNIQGVPYFLPKNVYNILNQLAQGGDDLAEDCLFVNVWSKPQVGSASKPVLVYIYGGGFNTGGTNTPAWSGQYFADTEDVVFVNFNYRVNVFGFPGAPGETQNVGLLDQRMAIEWVRDNIAGFGGDPNRITIFGHSAGAASVDYYTYAWAKDPIVKGTIMQSGTAISFGNKSPAEAEAAWYTVTQKVGCGNSSTSTADEVLACMRSSKVSMNDILAAEHTTGLNAILGNFGPTIDNATIFQNYTSLSLSPTFTPLPTLLGTVTNEPGIFVLLALGSRLTFPAETWQNFTLQTFTCPASTAALVRARASTTKPPSLWRYSYAAAFPNTDVATSAGKPWHGAELYPLFGSSEEVSGVESTARERELGAYVRGAWAAFARCPESGLEAYGWPRYEPEAGDGMLVVLGNASLPASLPSFESASVHDKGCPAIFLGSSQTLETLSALKEEQEKKEKEKEKEKEGGV